MNERSPYSPELLARYRAEFISPHCSECKDPCCRFGPNRWHEIHFTMPVSLEAGLAIETAGRWASWPLLDPVAERFAHGGGDCVREGYCPAFRVQSCLLYHDDARPSACAFWPFWDDRELSGDGREARVEGHQICSFIDQRHLFGWLQNETGIRFKPIWDEDLWHWWGFEPELSND